MTTADRILAKLESLGNQEDLAGMARFGIITDKAYGVRVPVLRKLTKEIGTDHELAQAIWDTGMHEARILASMVDDPSLVTEAQMESWVKDFDSWDICDLVCNNLFVKTELAFDKALEWADREEEYVKRSGFVLMACIVWRFKTLPDDFFYDYFPIIIREATDERNFVRKAVNWALRNIGKRNLALNAKAIEVAREIEKTDDKTAKWIAKDALRELTGEKVQERLKKKEKK